MSLDLLEHYIETGNSTKLIELLEAQPQLASQKTSLQVSPIMLSAYYKKTEIASLIFKYCKSISIFEAIVLGKTDFVLKAIDLNQNVVNEFSEDGNSPLYISSYFGDEEITRLLLLRDANPNLSSNNAFQIYPIHAAVLNNFNMIAKMLIEGGADCNVVQFLGNSPLHIAAKNGNIDLLIILLEAGADVNLKNSDGKKPSDLALESGHIEISRILT